jgi:hypothetical protein
MPSDRTKDGLGAGLALVAGTPSFWCWHPTAYRIAERPDLFPRNASKGSRVPVEPAELGFVSIFGEGTNDFELHPLYSRWFRIRRAQTGE